MPYDTNKELPESVQNVLPEHAQDVYREAFNSAYDQYDTPEERRGDADREETVHRVAWSAVKRAGYHKEGKGEGWVRGS